jgi:YfiH family protein
MNMPLEDTFLIQCERLSKLNWLVHGSTTRLFNPVPLQKKDELGKLAEMWHIKPKALLFAHQRHTNRTVFLDQNQFDTMNRPLVPYDKTDGVGTDVKGILTAVFTADCVPVFIVDSKKRRFMLVHAGWRGTLNSISSLAMENLIQRGSNPIDMIVWMGPAIGACCYIVSEELAHEFTEVFPKVAHAIKGRHIDLKEINAHQIREKGVPRENIMISEYCTQCHSDIFYSYRAMGALRGSIINAVMII